MSGTDILTLNSGSSSIKFALFHGHPEPESHYRGIIDHIGNDTCLTVNDRHGRTITERALGRGVDHHQALSGLLDWLTDQALMQSLTAVGHRVVHGGDRFTAPVRVDRGVLSALEDLIHLAPLHQPHNLEPVAALSRLRPDLPQVACFDTAFHATMPAVASRYALPRRFHEQGVRGYGFHGLSYEFITRRLTAEGDPGKTVVAHLGNGASLCALENGRSLATTMGFSTLEGLPMGTRCGTLDPGVVLYMQEHMGMSPAAVSRCLYRESGLLGVSGISNDMRELLASDADSAAQAVDLFCYRICRAVGSLAAALEGLDTLVFTGGIGEHAAPVREQVCRRLGWLGVDLDDAANERGESGIHRPGSRVQVRVIATDEEAMIARHTRDCLT